MYNVSAIVSHRMFLRNNRIQLRLKWNKHARAVWLSQQVLCEGGLLPCRLRSMEVEHSCIVFVLIYMRVCGVQRAVDYCVIASCFFREIGKKSMTGNKQVRCRSLTWAVTSWKLWENAKHLSFPFCDHVIGLLIELLFTFICLFIYLGSSQ